MANSRKRCKHCKEYFAAGSMVKTPGGTFCTFGHAQEHAQALLARKRKRDKAKAEKAHRAETRQRREALKTRGDHLKDAQKEFNRFIRLRDYGKCCISCGREAKKKNAGHYLTVGAHPELRFNESNCHLQCEHCNTYLSGNLRYYRAALIQKIGKAKVEWLEGPHKPLKLSVTDIKAIKIKYREKANELERALQ